MSLRVTNNTGRKRLLDEPVDSSTGVPSGLILRLGELRLMLSQRAGIVISEICILPETEAWWVGE